MGNLKFNMDNNTAVTNTAGAMDNNAITADAGPYVYVQKYGDPT